MKYYICILILLNISFVSGQVSESIDHSKLIGKWCLIMDHQISCEKPLVYDKCTYYIIFDNSHFCFGLLGFTNKNDKGSWDLLNHDLVLKNDNDTHNYKMYLVNDSILVLSYNFRYNQDSKRTFKKVNNFK